MSDTKTIKGKLEVAHKNEHGFWSIKVGNKWHNTGKKGYKDIEGNIVEFDIAENSRGYWDVTGDVRVVAASPSERRSGGGGGGNSTQVSIERQMSYKGAIEICSTLLGNELLAVGAKGKAYDNFIGFIDETAAHLYQGVSGKVPFHAEPEEDEADPAAPPSADWDPTEA